MNPSILNCTVSKSKGNSVKYVPYVFHRDPDHDHKNMVLKRPMSPHMTHYAPTLPAMTSIAQRATGKGYFLFLLPNLGLTLDDR